MERLPLLVSDFLLGRIVMGIEYSLDLEPTLGHGMPDVLQDNLIGYEWLSSPVDVDEGEHLMLNGVPLASTWLSFESINFVSATYINS